MALGVLLVTAAVSRLADFRSLHRGSHIVVCGCGRSLLDFVPPANVITIGVNDVGRAFHPRYLVVVNPLMQFSPERREHLTTSNASYLFTPYDDLAILGPCRIPIAFGCELGTDFSDPNVLHYAETSTYVATCLAIHMGATHVGLIGVDFTEHHFFGQTGVHPLSQLVDDIDRGFEALARAAALIGTTIVNLSAISRLQRLPRLALDAWMAETSPRDGSLGSPSA